MSSPKSRRELYSEATRAALLETAARMFTERGFTKTSLDDIAAATQVTRGAVYHHFANKQALFLATVEVQQQAVVEKAVAAALAVPDDLWAGTFAALDTFLDTCTDPTYVRLCWVEAPIALGWARMVEMEEQHMLGFIEKFVALLVEAGHIAPSPGRTAAKLVFHLLGGAGITITETSEAELAEVRSTCGTILKAMLTGLRIDR